MMGRKLDAVIAEALGYEVEPRRVLVAGYVTRDMIMTSEDDVSSTLPHYSTDGNAMLRLDKEMRERGHRVSIWLLKAGGYEVLFSKGVSDAASTYEKAVAETMPEAVALAAYKALTGKEW